MYPWERLPNSIDQSTMELYHALTDVASTLLGWVQTSTSPKIRKLFSIPLQDMIKDSQSNLFRILHYPSKTHRIVNPVPSSNLNRYSMPLFLHPWDEVSLSETHTAGSFLKERLEEIGLKLLLLHRKLKRPILLLRIQQILF